MNHLNGSKAFIEYSNEMDDTYKNVEEYNPKKMQNCDYLWWYDCWDA